MEHLMEAQSELFGKVRFINVDGKEYAVGSDIAKALGYAKPQKAIRDHCRHIIKRSIPHPQNNAKQLEVNVIPEGDIYRLITTSRLPQAQQFESWVFDEVLPQIMKTGGYIPIRKEDTDDDIIQRAMSIVHNYIDTPRSIPTDMK
ncbi:BRO-N domain-containing protein [Bacillus cereus]